MTEKPDWRMMVMYLLERYTQQQIATETGIDQAIISKIKNQKPYKSPLYEAGAKLIKMYDFAVYEESRREHSQT